MIEGVFARTDPEVLDDLRERLRRYREVPGVGGGADAGVAHAGLLPLIRTWADSYHWAAHEERLAAAPWVESQTPVPVRSMLWRRGSGAPAVVLLHGWPDSVLRFERILPALDDVTAVVPALPGFPFAAPTGRGYSSVELADAVAAALADYGIHDYVVSAGDVGCDVAEALAARHPESVRALHLTDVSQYHFLVDLPRDLDHDELAYVERGRAWQRAEGGYMHEQSTRPDTLSTGLGDSPAGLLAWVGEKLLRWTDVGPDDRAAFTDDELLTWVTAYWVSGSIGTSFAPYAAAAPKDWPRIAAPTVFTVFPRDLVNAPRRFAERFFAVADWREFPAGGHFAAWERPEDYLWGLRRALELADAR
jgi:pimeloyl-ACP methyl ester carboxylesterase